MGSDNTAPERPVAVVGDTNTHSFSVANHLDSGELVTGTPTVVEVTTTDLTITNLAGAANKGTVNAAALVINNVTVAIGMAIQFQATGYVDGTEYKAKITFTTDASPTQTKNRYVKFTAEA